MNTSLLEQELAPLKAQIEQIKTTLTGLEREMAATEAELETYAADRLRFDALRETCNQLERLDQLQAGQLFWGEAPEFRDPAGHIARLRSRIAGFDAEIGGVLERQANLKTQANRCVDELEYLYDGVDEAYARDERREEEFAIVREISAIPHPPAAMPWSPDDESDRRYRFTLRSAMTTSLLLAIVIRLVTVPVPVRPVVAQIPERLAMMVRQEPKKPLPVKKHAEEKKEKKQEKPGEKQVAKKEENKPQEKVAPERAKAAAVEQTAAPKKSQSVGVLAFKEAFKDLIDESSAARLGTEARLSASATQSAGNASRNLVAMQGSGGNGNGVISRNIGSGGIGSAAVGRSIGGSGDRDGRIGRSGGFAQVKSAIAATGVADAKPITAGGRPSRTDEEIQILFDRYKAALYRIYNTELRKDPTLRGKMVLKITIEPNGAVSACSVDSTNMNAPGFSEQIVERVKKFNFGPKDGVPKTTILYPIDFLPAR